MSIRFAASLAAAMVLCACSAPKSTSTGAAASAAPSAASASGPANAPVASAGRPGAVPLDAAQRAQLDAAVAKVPAAERATLRYALATGDDGKPHLVVYDGEGLGVTGRRPGRPREYVVFKVLNARGGEHYDPQQNSLVAPIPPPPQRDSAVSP